MQAIENVDPKDLVAQAEAELTKERTEKAVRYLKRKIAERDQLRTSLKTVEDEIDAISKGDWDQTRDDECPYNYGKFGGHIPSFKVY